MSVNSRIIAALDLGIPCVPVVYTGAATEYITFNYATLPDDFGDDAPAHERYLIQVHYVCPLSTNPIPKQNVIKQKLVAAGFTWPEMTPAGDGTIQHYTFECEDAEGVS